MSECYIGEIRLLPYVRGAPNGWQICDGSLMAINEYDILFTLLGTTYGGDGQQTFAVPDLRGRVPVHQGTGRGLSTHGIGELGGEESVTLLGLHMGPHTHMPLASTADATSNTPTAHVLAALPTALNEVFYNQGVVATTPVPFPITTLQPSGGQQPHDNTAPTLTLQYCIAWQGIYPSQP